MMKLLVVIWLSLFCHIQADGSVCDTEACHALSKHLKTYMNESVNPCDDFYEYACGNFAQVYPPNTSPISIRQNDIMFDLDEAMKAKEESGSNSTAVRFMTKLYQQCSQNDTRGLEPLKKAVEELRQVQGNWTDLYAKLVGTFGVQVFFQIALIKGTDDTYFIQLNKATGGIAPLYFTEPKYHQELEKYRNYIHDVAILMEMKDNTATNKTIDRILDLEGKLAKAYEIKETDHITYYKLSELAKTMKNRADWAAILNQIKVLTGSKRNNLTGDDVIQVRNGNYMLEALDVLNKANESDVRNLFTWFLVRQYGPLTTDEFRELEKRYREEVGDLRRQPPKEFCLDLIGSKFEHVLERVYVDRYFEGDVEKQAARMITELRKSFGSILKETTWLDKQTQNLALEKLEAITAHLGLPKWEENSTELDMYYGFTQNIEAVPGEFLKSVFRLQQEINGQIFYHNGALESYHIYSVWMLPPLIANAAYVPMLNAIYIPTGIIRPPFFDATRPYVMNYAQLGMVIGHELTHGFDNNGRKYDKTGALHNWWTNQTLTEFIHRTECFVQQYGSVFDEYSKTQLNGKKTLGENIADNGGIKESHRAFLNHQKKDGHPCQVLPNMKANPEQLYFLSFAWNFCDSSTPETMREQIQMDVHSPNRYRALIPLRNSADFAAAFNCPAGSKMNPTHKCAVW